LDERIDQYQSIDWTIMLGLVHPSSTACNQSQKPNDGAVPADSTGTQEFWHEVRSKCLANRPKYSLKQSVKEEENGNRYYSSSISKAKIRDEKDHERRQQDVSSTPSNRKKPRLSS
jgi:hypothetical protein